MADSAVAKRVEGGAVVEPPASGADAFLAMIERAARDPQVDVSKMERLFDMRERVIAQNAKSEYSAALLDLQPNLPPVVMHGKISHGKDKNGDPEVKSRYAKWEDIHEAIMPVLKSHGFVLSFKTSGEGGKISVTAILTHSAGHAEETSLTLPTDKTGAKNDVQAVGSSVSYGKRYTACALLNIRTIGEDDDGETAAHKREAAGLDASVGSPNGKVDDGIGRGKSAYQAKKDGDWERVAERLREEMKEHATASDARIWWGQVVKSDEEYKALPRSWRQMFMETEFEPFLEGLKEMAK